ncbi:MAG: cbb3-type cytochrome c oxidase subunit 3 [gamma proteobacterium symbiont of Taylorina sp.]|nr:cbb3-type cytochrome c oxidase subunit 3 [gamma proteobacterium symbiont of Taylorina sp.]
MSDSTGYFYTDWSAMTSHDWAGLIITVVTFVLMVIAYFYVFRPKNKDELEAHKYMLLDDEPTNTEKK